jgi:transcription elongation factor GreA
MMASQPDRQSAPVSGHDERHALLEELDLLRERRRELAEDLELEDRPDDIGDQSEDIQRRDELDWIELEIRDLTHLLYVAARRDNVAPERVGVGASVLLRYPDGAEDTVQVTSVPDEDIPAVTPGSPLGRALIGAALGEEITWLGPEGRLRARVQAITTPSR